MVAFHKPEAGSAERWEDAPLGAFLDALAPHREKKLAVFYDGRVIQPGYHVTEVKSGRFDALDCGANPESWTETFIQLWDVPAKPGGTFMPVSKFLAIMQTVAEKAKLDLASKVTFEVSEPGSAMRIFGVGALDADGDTIRLSLERRPASCKPRDRWLEKESRAAACCA